MKKNTMYRVDKRILYIILMAELTICYSLDLVFQKNLFLLAILGDILIFLGSYIFLHDIAIVILTLISSYIVNFLVYNLGAPSILIYISDVFISMMLIKLIIKIFKSTLKTNLMYVLIFIFLTCSICGYILSSESVTLYIRNLYFDYLRYFILFLFMINTEYSENEVIKYARMLFNILLIQVPIVIFQYFWSLKHWIPKSAVDIRQDYLCGILGERSTTELGLYIIIALSMMFVLYTKNKLSFKYISSMVSILIAAAVISEVKFVLFFLPCLFFFILLMNFNRKSVTIFFITSLMIVVSFNKLVKVYPEFQGFLSFKSVEKYSSDSYASSGIGRTDSFIVANRFLNESNENLLLGYGIGQADSISSLRFSAFNISQYMIETGYLGISCLYGIFIYVFYISLKLIKNKKNDFFTLVGYYGLFVVIMIIISTFNNRSMTKINFAVTAWISIGVVYKYYCMYQNRLNI